MRPYQNEHSLPQRLALMLLWAPVPALFQWRLLRMTRWPDTLLEHYLVQGGDTLEAIIDGSPEMSVLKGQIPFEWRQE